jgi:hypothetical protein
MSIFTIINLVFSFILGIAILIYYFSHFKEINSFIKYGLFIFALYFILMLLGGISIFSMPLTIVSYIKITIYACIGMHLCSELKFKDMPLTRKLFHADADENIDLKSYILSVIAVIIGSVVFSYALFKITSPSTSDAIKRILENQNITVETGIIPSIELIFIFLGIVIAEEITFRFVICNYLVKIFKLGEDKYWIAVLLSSLLWTFAHANTLNPEWIKFAQIFPIGLALGGMMKKFGLESCILAHAGFNIIMIFLSEGLIG